MGLFYKDLPPRIAVSVINDIMKSSELTAYKKCIIAEQFINEEIDEYIVKAVLLAAERGENK